LIQKHEKELLKRGIILVPAENLRGDPAFADLVLDPPTSEREFENIWRLYFLSLIGLTFQSQNISGTEAMQLRQMLQGAGLLPTSEMTLNGILKSVQTYVRRFIHPKAVEGTIGAHGELGARIVFDEPDEPERKRGNLSMAELFKLANTALKDERKRIWLLLDRLDVAFDESGELEKNALRALFRAYRTVRAADNIVLKIFLRSDIWEKIADTGFREATHLSRDLTLTWEPASLQNLIIRRLVNNSRLTRQFGVAKRKVLEDVDEQQKLFDRVFPGQVEAGERQSTTMDWLIKRTTDGTGKSAPRELVLFLNALKDVQIQRLERGEAQPPGDNLFDRSSFKLALPKVSEYRTTKVLYAEYPHLKPAIEALRSKKTEHNVRSLARIWGVSEAEATARATQLMEVGFFERRDRGTTTYWVPFIYRPYLSLTQGRGEGD
jgi:hypothetical protein